MLLAFVLFISGVTALLPIWLPHIFGITGIKTTGKTASWLPLLAGFFFFIAWFLPDVHISPDTTTFQQHFVGGGMYGAVLYMYFKQVFGWRANWVQELLFLFGWISALGVANELLEFALTSLGIAHIGTGDTDWDLLANTLGAFAGYAAWYSYTIVHRLHRDL